MTDLNQDTIDLAEQNNRLIQDAILGRLFPLKTGPQIWTFRNIMDQIRSTKRLAVSARRSHSRKPL